MLHSDVLMKPAVIIILNRFYYSRGQKNIASKFHVQPKHVWYLWIKFCNIIIGIIIISIIETIIGIMLMILSGVRNIKAFNQQRNLIIPCRFTRNKLKAEKNIEFIERNTQLIVLFRYKCFSNVHMRVRTFSHQWHWKWTHAFPIMQKYIVTKKYYILNETTSISSGAHAYY